MLGCSTTRALLGRGREVDLELGVGKDDRSYVATLDDDVAGLGEVTLLGDHRFAHARHPRNGADGVIDLGRSNRCGDVDSCDGDEAGQRLPRLMAEGDLVCGGNPATASSSAREAPVDSTRTATARYMAPVSR